MNFKELGISKEVLQVIQEEGFPKPTEIQAKSIPLVVQGKDVIACAKTGSGKTLAFASGILKTTHRGGGVQALILTPTRELAQQIMTELRRFSKYNRRNILAVYGGVGINPQIAQLKKTDIVVGTPGRILDHLERRTIDLRSVNTVILDEADRMFDMGFIDDVRKIISQCPRKRQTMLFSATISTDVVELARRHMHNPVRVNAADRVDPSKLNQVYYDVQDQQKFALLVHLLKKEHPGLVMVFCNTQKSTEFIARNLTENGIKAYATHGALSQQKRNKVIEQFHSGQVRVLVCTDVAARGLDIKGVSHVYNFDAPNEAKQYVHRIGRTARAGKNGMAINLVASRDHDNFGFVMQDSTLKIKKVPTPKFPKVRFKWNPQRRDNREGQRRGPGPNRGYREPGRFPKRANHRRKHF